SPCKSMSNLSPLWLVGTKTYSADRNRMDSRTQKNSLGRKGNVDSASCAGVQYGCWRGPDSPRESQAVLTIRAAHQHFLGIHPDHHSGTASEFANLSPCVAARSVLPAEANRNGTSLAKG